MTNYSILLKSQTALVCFKYLVTEHFRTCIYFTASYGSTSVKCCENSSPLSFIHYLKTTEWEKLPTERCLRKLSKLIWTLISIAFTIFNFEVWLKLGVSERGNVLTMGMNQLNCSFYHIFRRGMCHLRFLMFALIWSQMLLLLLEVLCRFVHPEEQGNPLWQRSCIIVNAGIPPTQQQSHMNSLCVNSDGIKPTVGMRQQRELDH